MNMSNPLILFGDDGPPELICGDYVNPFNRDLTTLIDEFRTAGDIVISGKRIVEALRDAETKETI